MKCLFDKNTFVDIDLGLLVKNVNQIKMDEVERELAVVNPESNKTILEVKRREIKSKMDACKDEFDDVIPEKQDEYNSLRKELISIKNQIDATSDSAPTDLKLGTIFNYAYLVSNVDSIKRIIESLKEHIIERKAQYIEEVNDSLNTVETKFNKVEEKISVLKNQIKEINDSIIEIQERDDVQDIQENKSKLDDILSKIDKQK